MRSRMVRPVVIHCGAAAQGGTAMEGVRRDETHPGPGCASDCGRETLLDCRVERLTVLSLRSLLAMLGKKPEMEERRDEGRDAEPWIAGDNSVEPYLSLSLLCLR